MKIMNYFRSLPLAPIIPPPSIQVLKGCALLKWCKKLYNAGRSNLVCAGTHFFSNKSKYVNHKALPALQDSSFLTPNYSRGFTLAEVLITLVVLGIVAAVTVPTLRSSLDNKRYIVPLKKSYAALSEAFDLYFNDAEIGKYLLTSQFIYFFTDFRKGLNIARICCSDNSMTDFTSADCYKNGTLYSTCFAQPIPSDISSEHTVSYFTDNYKVPVRASFLLKDGVSVAIYPYHFDSTNSTSINDIWTNMGIKNTYREFPEYTSNNKTFRIAFLVFIDVNGLQGPNILAKDVFGFVYTKDSGLIPAGTDGNGACSNSYWGCTFWRLNSGD